MEGGDQEVSTSIDERIVAMKFDGKQFQNGVSESLNSLNKLKSGLDLKGATSGLEAIDASAKRINFDGMSGALEGVKVKFSALQVVAVTALSNIANSAIEAGKNLISSLTIDPIMDGFREYETQMNAIQTILANTSSKGTTLDQVKGALQELNTYSDKTIYNFTEMTKNIGTFTAAGVDLKTSTAAIKGIANLAAVSGSNSQQASSAMYQLSQALASGKVTLQDWNSVVNAGMGGAVFQNALRQTAKVMGKNVDEAQSFRESIDGQSGTGWLTSDVLLKTLEQFTGDMSEAELSAQGFTKEQIDGIMKMGVTANDAATKVKTFTQLLDTLKEAVGSGWAQTWQTIFGDFEEAKTMFTEVSNTLGAIIGKSSKARNDMLKGWKDLGGRTALIDAIKNAFEGVMSIIGSVSKAFRDIFPPTTSEQLFSFTEGLKNLTEKLKLSDGTLNLIYNTFKGVFAVLDIGKTIFLAVANAIGIMVGGTGNLAASILEITASIGQWLVALDNSIKQSDVFNKVLSALAYGIRNGFNTIGTIISAITKGIGMLATAIGSKLNFSGFEVFKTFLEGFGKGVAGAGDAANTMASTVSNAFTQLGVAIQNSKLVSFLTAVWDTVTKVAGAIGSAMSKMVDAIAESLKNVNFDGIIAAVGAMSVGGMFLAFKKFLGGLSEPVEEAKGFFEKIGGAFDGIKGTLDGVRDSLETYQQNLKADILLKIAAAIALLAASIAIIASIDSEKLASSLAAMGGLFAELLVAMKVYTSISDMKLKAAAASGVMLVMSTSILILSVAMKNLSELDWEGIMRGGAGIALLAKILVSTAKGLSEGSGYMIRGAAGMLGFALSIKILADVCKDLGNLNWEQLKMGLMGVAGLMATVSLFLNNTTFGPKAISNAAGILILSGAIKVLASAVKDFATMSWDSIVTGLKSIGILLGELAVFSKLGGSSKGMISTGLGMIAIGAAMKILASAVKDFASMSWDSLATGLKAMAVALAEIAVAMNVMPKNMLVTSVGLMGVGIALGIIADSLAKFASMSWDSLVTGLKAMGISLAILAVALNAMTGAIPGAAALMIASGALLMLAPALLMLGSMSWEAIIKGLTMLAGTFAVLGIAALVLTPLVPTILALSAAIVLLGIGTLGVGAGLALVGVGLTAAATGLTLLATSVAAGATAIVAGLSVIITGVAALIPAVMTKIVEGIVAFCKALADGIPSILTSVTTIITAIVNCIVQNVPTIVNGVLQTLSAILAALVQWIPTIGKQVADIIVAILNVISQNLPNIVKAGVDVVVSFVQGVADSLPKVIDSAFKLIVSFINGLADAIRNNADLIANACLNLVTAIVDGINTLVDKFVDAGVNCVKGFIRGIGKSISDVISAGKELGRAALEAAKKALDSHSPSREFKKLGSFSGEGYVIGLKGYGSRIINAASNVGSNAIDAMSSAIAGISDIANTNIDSEPVIRPVMDLTDVQNGSNQLYSMMGDLDNYGINGSISDVSARARSILNKPSIDDSSSTSTQGSNSLGNPSTPKQPAVLQLVLQNGRAIAEYLVDDMDQLMGNKNIITGRMVGQS